MRVVTAAAYVRIVSASKQKTWSIVFSVTQRSWNPSASARCATRRIVSTSIGSGERWGSETPRAIFTRLSSWLVLDHLTVRRLHREAGAVREDLLDLEEVVQPVVAELAPHAALLVSAPDPFHGLGVVVPNPDRARANPPGDAHGARVVGAPHAGDQAKVHRVRQLDRLGLVAERRHGDDGTEDLFLAEPGRVVDAVEDCGLDVVAVVVAGAGKFVAAGDQPEPLVHAVLDVLLDHALLDRGDQRPHVGGRFRRMPDLDLPRQLRHAGQELLVNALLHEQARGGAARLAGVAEHAEDGGAGRRLDIGVVEDQVRGLAAQLEADALHLHAGLGPDPLARPCLAGEGDLVDLLAGDDLRAHDGPRPWHQVQDSLRKPGLLYELHQLVGRGRRVARRLDHDRAAGGDGGSDLPRRLRQGEVPGRDHADHPHGLLDQIDRGAAGQREALAVELAGEPRVELEDVRRGRDVGCRLPHRHADLETDDPGEAIGVVAHQARSARQHLLPQLAVVDPVARVAVEGGPRGVDGRARVLLCSFLGDGRHFADVRRILSREPPAARGLAFLTVDDQGAVQRQLEAFRLCSHGSLPRAQDVSTRYRGGENSGGFYQILSTTAVGWRALGAPPVTPSARRGTRTSAWWRATRSRCARSSASASCRRSQHDAALAHPAASAPSGAPAGPRPDNIFAPA